MSSTPARTCFRSENVVCVPGAMVGITGALAPRRPPETPAVLPALAKAEDAAPVDTAVAAVAPTPSPTALVKVRLLIISSPSRMPSGCLPSPQPCIAAPRGHISHMTPRHPDLGGDRQVQSSDCFGPGAGDAGWKRESNPRRPRPRCVAPHVVLGGLEGAVHRARLRRARPGLAARRRRTRRAGRAL